MENLIFNPVDGYENPTSFPDPQSEAQTRAQLMELHKQTRDYINGELKTNVENKANQSDLVPLEGSISELQNNVGTLENEVDELNNNLSELDKNKVDKTELDDLIYKSGDQIEFAKHATFAGDLTSSSKAIFFVIPLSKTIKASSCKITGSISIRGIESYIESGSQGVDLSDSVNYNVTTAFIPSGIHVDLRKKDGTAFVVYGTTTIATNNTPVVCSSSSSAQDRLRIMFE